MHQWKIDDKFNAGYVIDWSVKAIKSSTRVAKWDHSGESESGRIAMRNIEMIPIKIDCSQRDRSPGVSTSSGLNAFTLNMSVKLKICRKSWRTVVYVQKIIGKYCVDLPTEALLCMDCIIGFGIDCIIQIMTTVVLLIRISFVHFELIHSPLIMQNLCFAHIVYVQIVESLIITGSLTEL